MTVTSMLDCSRPVVNLKNQMKKRTAKNPVFTIGNAILKQQFRSCIYNLNYS